MENENISSKQIMINYGLLLGFIGILYNLVLYATGTLYNPHWSLGTLILVVSVVILILGIKKFKMSNDGFLRLRDALKIGLGVALISGIIGVIYTMIFANIIEPNHYEYVVEVRESQILEQYPNFSDEQLEAALTIPKMMATPGMATAMGIASSLIFGFVVSLIGGLIMKKSNEEITSI
tara:strand:- start:738 stop:1274 length:537 start_codon:yes stop_codon:yes gene_type:complete